MQSNLVTDTVRNKACKDFNRFHGDFGPGPDQVKISICSSCGIMQIKGGCELTKFGNLLLSACMSLKLNLQALEEWNKLPVDLKGAWTVYNHNGTIYHLYEKILLTNPGESVSHVVM